MSTDMPVECGPARVRSAGDGLAAALIAVAGVNWCFQAVWFWRYCGRNINADAVSYIGIARHIADGEFEASVHGYWSPLISWLIAVASLASNDRTLAARLLMLLLFALCLALAYV